MKKRIEKLNESALLKADQTAFRVAVIRKVNQLVEAMNTGVVWDNKVQADRKVEKVYDDLPISVIAEMIDEECTECEEELFGGTENE